MFLALELLHRLENVMLDITALEEVLLLLKTLARMEPIDLLQEELRLVTVEVVQQGLIVILEPLLLHLVPLDNTALKEIAVVLRIAQQGLTTQELLCTEKQIVLIVLKDIIALLLGLLLRLGNVMLENFVLEKQLTLMEEPLQEEAQLVLTQGIAQ
jgi:hypothetical protein